jgi:hypothetical protein
MIPLYRKQFPASKAELAEAIDQALRRCVQKAGPIVEIHSRVFPYLDEIAINLDGAKIDSVPPPVPPLVGETKLAFEAAAVTLSARNLSVRGVPLNLRMEARDVVLHKGCDENGDAVLVGHKVRDGSLAVSASQLDLENGIAEMARQQGRKHGIVIEQVRLAMRARGARSLAADVRVQARKFLLRARLDIYGQLDIDQNFAAKIWDLRCKSDNAVGALACSALEPVFQALNGRTFALKSLPLGEIQLRDVRLAVADTVEATVDFGSSQ